MLNTNMLQSQRVRLNALTSDDVPTLMGWFADTSFARLYDARVAAPRTYASIDNWIDDFNRSNNGYLFAIRPLGDETLLGFLELESILWAHRNAWLSVAIGEAANRGRGYGGAAIELALRFAFDELNLHRVQLTVFSYNTRAIALYERLGFVREGTHREYLQRDGARHDMHLYGMLRQEWLAHPGSLASSAAAES